MRVSLPQHDFPHRAGDRLHRQPGRHGGALGRAALDVLRALLWAFHNARTGCCFPSYETIAEKAGVARSTVAVALKTLEFAGVLTWQNRITRIPSGADGWRWRVIRTSDAYVFRDPAWAASVAAPVCGHICRGGRPQDCNRPLCVCG